MRTSPSARRSPRSTAATSTPMAIAKSAGSTARSTRTTHHTTARGRSAFGSTAKNLHSFRARRRSNTAQPSETNSTWRTALKLSNAALRPVRELRTAIDGECRTGDVRGSGIDKEENAAGDFVRPSQAAPGERSAGLLERLLGKVLALAGRVGPTWVEDVHPDAVRGQLQCGGAGHLIDGCLGHVVSHAGRDRFLGVDGADDDDVAATPLPDHLRGRGAAAVEGAAD